MEDTTLIDDGTFVASGRIHLPNGSLMRRECPLIVAIHGGGFTAGYFDVPGYSLLDKAPARGFGVVGLDRLGHGQSRSDDLTTQSFSDNQLWIVEAIARIWPSFEDKCSGIVLVGHSIGAALSMIVAANKPEWPLAGVAVSGAAFAPNPALAGYFGNLPTIPWLHSPVDDKDRLMLGVSGTYDPEILHTLHAEYRPAATQELAEIHAVWAIGAVEYLEAIEVPVHFRMGEQDFLWTVDADMTEKVASLVSKTEGGSASVVRNAGHAIDFHHVGPVLQQDQLDFACASLDRRR